MPYRRRHSSEKKKLPANSHVKTIKKMYKTYMEYIFFNQCVVRLNSVFHINSRKQLVNFFFNKYVTNFYNIRIRMVFFFYSTRRQEKWE